MNPTVAERHLAGRWFAGRGHRSDEGVWPSAEQELLLRAALADGQEAATAWERWAAAVGTDRMEPGSAQLLPLVYRNLNALGVEDRRLAGLKTRYAFTWARNQRLFLLLAETLTRLRNAGIETLVFKGAALVPLYYGDDGARGMADFDVLVPTARFHDAARVLEDEGWRTKLWQADLFDPRFQHALAFYDATGNSVDLHCHLLMACCEPDADDPFWAVSRPLEVHGVATRTLCATDHMVQICVHGLNWVRVPPIRWVGDAITVLRSASGEVDWDRIEMLARERGLAFPLGETLGYLKHVFEAPIPATVLERLEAVPVSGADRLRFRVWMESSRGRPVRLLLHHYAMYSRGVQGTGMIERITTVPAYLRFWAHTDKLWKIPLRLGRKGVRVIGSRLGIYRYWDA